MSSTAIGRPEASEHAPYYEQYISLVPEGDILSILHQQLDQTSNLFNEMTDEQASYRYAPDKWSIKELLGHIIDTERIMSYRALRFARNDQTAIEGFEQDDYVKNAEHDNYKLKDLIDEFTHVRQATIMLLKGLDQAAWLRKGTANNKEISVRALVYIITGHESHHINVLKAKYLTR